MVSFPLMVAARALIACAAVFLGSGAARAQLFSAHDGYADDGQYRVQVEVTPYLWIPAVGGTVHFASARLGSRDFKTGFPTAAQLKDTLHAAFMGSTLLRYGPWSAEMDLQYIDGSQSSAAATGRNGRVFQVNTGLSLARVAPGFGYTVYSGAVLGVPTMVDARIGFAYLVASTTLTGEAILSGSGGTSDTSFVQPWFGGRVTFVPTPRWRVEFAAIAQGLGVENGSWGWGASLIGSYALTSWATLSLGFRALNTQRAQGPGDLRRSDDRAFSMTAYGPVAGVGFRF
jgi:hypothetical protein